MNTINVFGKRTFADGFKLLSKYRSVLMGLAMLWVMYFHTPVIFSEHNQWLFHRIGFYGVDIFLFLSAFGLYYSLSKHKNIWQFYKARFIRIFPAFFIVATVWFAIQSMSGELNYLAYVSSVAYWFNMNHFDWYIPTLLALYIISPFVYYLIKRFENSALPIVVGLMMISPILAMWSINANYTVLMGSIVRLPVFLFGMYIGYMSYSGKPYKKSYWIYIISAIFIGYLLSDKVNTLLLDKAIQSGVNCYPALFLAPALCFLIVGALGLIDMFVPKFTTVITFPIKIIGICSLEVYLLHERIQTYMTNYQHYNNQWIIILITFVVAIAMHYALFYIGKLISHLIKYAKKAESDITLTEVHDTKDMPNTNTPAQHKNTLKKKEKVK
ncbi:MAG TPA: acyltransferase [Clostridiales bacterium]|nr:acyltransferase [Clostridiales bacterium]